MSMVMHNVFESYALVFPNIMLIKIVNSYVLGSKEAIVSINESA